MADVDNMTDAELRTKLLEFGFPVMPITGTTRKVMTKKLKILLENRSKTAAAAAAATANADGRRSLGKYSSEEESDEDARAAARREAKARRATMAAPVAKAPVRKTIAARDGEALAAGPRTIEERRVVTRTAKTVKTLENDFDTGSDTESEVIETTYKTSSNNHEYQSPQPSILPTSTFLNLRKSPAKMDMAAKSPISFASGLSSTGRYTSFTGGTNDYAADRLNQIRSRLSLGTTDYTKLGGIGNETGDQTDTPFLSSFTQRLSQLSSSQRGDYDVRREPIVENDTNGSSYAPKYMSRPVKRDFVRDYHQTGKRSHFRNNLVSCAVIAFALLFFVGLAILYMGIRDGQTGVDNIPAGLHVLYCNKTNIKDIPALTCVTDTDLQDAVNLYAVLKPELLRTAIDYWCSGKPGKGYMDKDDILKYIRRNFPSMYSEERHIANVQILALTNPDWEISVLKNKGAETLLGDPVRDIVELINVKADGNNMTLAVLNPTLPWKCSIYNKLSVVVHITIVCSALFAILYLTNTAYKYYKHYRQKQKDELYYMVERIVDTLQSNASEDGENFLVINHVRDMIIPINDRPRMERVWKKAVKFIGENESRVRTEMQVVQGEPYEVWRWLGSPALNSSGVRNKSWQGQAFETQVGSVNSLPCSPTPCLKVRGMVDDGDRNLRTIREAVLSKCAHQCRILHCAVDTASQCVYLKCANQADAAVAYRSLHGWWYAGNLVTVKYLRLERYMQRYPDSPVSGPPYLKAVQPGTEWVS